LCLSAVIPGESVGLEGKSDQKKFAATGEEEVGDKARGQITIYNSFSSESQPLVVSTKFVSQGLTFRSLASVTVPGARIEDGETLPGQAKVQVEAEVAGDSYNIGSANFAIPNLSADKQSDIYGKSVSSFTGGSSKKIKVVSDSDLDKAKNDLWQETSDQLITKLQEKIGTDKVLAVGVLQKEIAEVESSVDSGVEANDFELVVKGKITGFAFKKDDLAIVLTNKYSELVPSDKYIVDKNVNNGISYESVEEAAHSEEAVSLKVVINKKVAWRLEETKIKNDIKGKDELFTKDYLANDSNIVAAEVSFWPFWVSKVPRTDNKIEIRLDSAETTDSITEDN